MIKKITLVTILLAVLQACSSTKDNEDSGFNRTLFLQQSAQNLIIPAYQAQKTSVDALVSAIDAFISQPSETSLVAAQNAWILAFTDWQRANSFNFGPAGEQGLRKSLVEEIGTFPVSTAKIESRIAANSFNVNDFDRDARGFLAVEYLLFGSAPTDAAIVSRTSEVGFAAFLTALAENIQERINTVLTAWDAEELTSFTSNNGTDAGSSTSNYYNEFVKSFEALKNFKVGLPLGLRPGQTQTEPYRVEGYYSEADKIYLFTHYQSIKEIWNGKNNDLGFKEYLENVTGGSDLITETEAQFTRVEDAFAAIPNNVSLNRLAETEDERFVNLHTELQRLTRFLKSDLSSLIGIAITYSSGDGD